MVDGLHRFLDRELANSVEGRQQQWSRNYSSSAAYEASIEKNRTRFRRIIGAVDPRLPGPLEIVSLAADPSIVAQTQKFTIRQARWPVLPGIWGEGLLLEPVGEARVNIVALADADQTPEQLAGLAPGIAPASQFARILAENGCRVLVPVLIDRSFEFSGNPDLPATRARKPRQPHREWLYRMAYEMGRHVIGFEVQKILAAVDWFQAQGNRPTGVAGYGEGGLIAFYSAAADSRIGAALVSGYFQPRESMWQQPIYRNVWSLLTEFGDAEIASLIFPRSLVIENSSMPDVPDLAFDAANRRQPGITPGRIANPPLEETSREFERARSVWNRLPAGERGRLDLISGHARLSPGVFGTRDSLQAFLNALGSTSVPEVRMTTEAVKDRRQGFDPKQRQLRQVRQIEDHVQGLLRTSEQVRDAFFLKQMPTKPGKEFEQAAVPYREHFWNEVIGKVAEPLLAPKPRTRLRYDQEKWTGYDVVLDVWPDVFAWGILLLPKDLRPGEKRPVVVAQHGLEGLPQDVIETGVESYSAYRAFAASLADQGYIVYAPHNPYRGHDRFRQLQFKANPLKLSLFSFIIGQHRQQLDWLKSLPQVDPERIGFYGLSYGGKAAMRIPAVLEDYALSICSGDFNEWIWKNVTTTWPNSYMFTGEYEMYEFDLGMTFNYAEMAYLIFPRPFMVERGHRDGVGLDEWVAYEYAKVRRLYDEQELGHRAEIEFFNGVHEIHGKGTFDFLSRHLNWPGRSAAGTR
jgi:dienelactone hydrolase